MEHRPATRHRLFDGSHVADVSGQPLDLEAFEVPHFGSGLDERHHVSAVLDEGAGRELNR